MEFKSSGTIEDMAVVEMEYYKSESIKQIEKNFDEDEEIKRSKFNKTKEAVHITSSPKPAHNEGNSNDIKPVQRNFQIEEELPNNTFIHHNPNEEDLPLKTIKDLEKSELEKYKSDSKREINKEIEKGLIDEEVQQNVL